MPPAPAASFFVYILRCSDGSLYVGHTSNIKQRLKTHNDGKGVSWTAERCPVQLLYSESATDEPSAIRREFQIKRWTPAKKLALISSDRQHLKTLTRCRAQHGSSAHLRPFV